MGDNTEMGRLAVTEELHAKQQEAARKEAERAARKAPQDAAADAKGVAYRCPIEFRHQVARLEPGTLGRRLRVDLEDDCSGRPNPFWTLVPRRRRPAAQAGAAADRRSRLIRRVAPGRRGDGARRDVRLPT